MRTNGSELRAIAQKLDDAPRETIEDSRYVTISDESARMIAEILRSEADANDQRAET